MLREVSEQHLYSDGVGHLPASKKAAHQVLDLAKYGAQMSEQQINQALVITGDLPLRHREAGAA